MWPASGHPSMVHGFSRSIWFTPPGRTIEIHPRSQDHYSKFHERNV